MNVMRYHETIPLLTLIGCCLRCAFRISGIHFSTWNIQLKSYNTKRKFNEASNLSSEALPCVVCLGILQNEILKIFNHKMKNNIDITSYDCDTISFFFNIPFAIQVREQIVIGYLPQKMKYLINASKVKILSIKDVWKWIFMPKMREMNKTLKTFNQSSLMMEIHISYMQDQDECTELLKNYLESWSSYSSNTMKQKKYITRKTIDIILNSVPYYEFEKYVKIPSFLPTNFATIDKLIYKHDSLFFGGRYMKLSRQISQTPWLIHGKLRTKTSVQEIICRLTMEFTKATSAKFLSSGREDVDVRMLSDGRPFAVELINPKITKFSFNDLTILSQKINSKYVEIQINKTFKEITKIDLKKLKVGEYSKSKTYRAVCIYQRNNSMDFFIKNIGSVKDLNITQKTPIRVLHRRSLSPRKRIIHELRARIPNSEELKKYQQYIKNISDGYGLIILDLKTQAGTYIKEFIHGDFGRTNPNLCYICKTNINILALDVTDISLKWP